MAYTYPSNWSKIGRQYKYINTIQEVVCSNKVDSAASYIMSVGAKGGSEQMYT